MGSKHRKRTERIQVMIADDELDVIDSWRYRHMIPTRSAAIRALLQRGLLSEEPAPPGRNAGTQAYRVLPGDRNTPGGRPPRPDGTVP